MTPLNEPLDTDAAAMAAFKREGAMLFSAEVAADALVKRLSETPPAIQLFHISRDELEALAKQFKETVDVAKDYHIGASDLAA